MRTPSECAVWMIDKYGGKDAAIEQARKFIQSPWSIQIGADWPSFFKSNRFWRDVLAALGDPEFISK